MIGYLFTELNLAVVDVFQRERRRSSVTTSIWRYWPISVGVVTLRLPLEFAAPRKLFFVLIPGLNSRISIGAHGNASDFCCSSRNSEKGNVPPCVPTLEFAKITESPKIYGNHARIGYNGRRDVRNHASRDFRANRD